MIKVQRYLPKKRAIVAVIYKQNASKVIQMLRDFPSFLDKQSHLKRIRKRQDPSQYVEILLCLQTQEEERVIIKTALKEYIVQIIEVSIPINAPNTKEQYLEWSQHWPINFIQLEIYRQIKHSQQELFFLQKCLQKQEQFIIFSDQKELYERKQDKFCIEGTIQHPIMKLLQNWPQSEAFNNLPSAYYLTKLRLFCSVPICGMCAMALVHSRLQRIYFGDIQIPEEAGDILCCQKLNHRVRIFRVLSVQ